MKNLILLATLLSVSKLLSAQEGNIVMPNKSNKYTVSYEQLRQYEGLYEYLNNSTLKIAASPKDTMLYAIISESRYKLSSVEKDLFTDMTQNEVRFFRDHNNKIAGYYVGKDTLKLLNKKVKFPKEMWYPRLETNSSYTYYQPRDLKDGLSTGDVNNSGLDKSLLNEMMKRIIDGQYPNVHSILIAKDGKLVFEEYFYEYNQSKLHELRSATKSFISALAGIAIDKGYIKSKTEKVLSYFPEYTIKNNSPAKQNITIENLLTNQSGLDCDITNPNSAGNEAVMGTTDDWVKFILDLPMIDSAGG